VSVLQETEESVWVLPDNVSPNNVQDAIYDQNPFGDGDLAIGVNLIRQSSNLMVDALFGGESGVLGSPENAKSFKSQRSIGSHITGGLQSSVKKPRPQGAPSLKKKISFHGLPRTASNSSFRSTASSRRPALPSGKSPNAKGKNSVPNDDALLLPSKVVSWERYFDDLGNPFYYRMVTVYVFEFPLYRE
jgi:hypothetical protein